jgi:hypothetical protein
MASITNFGRGEAQALKERKPLPPDPSCQPCPDCGGLECLCRPRFFAGQLLSEQDLNRLDQYIVEKNKLHNRHLFGSGVVCGLEVKCSPCDDGYVSVTPGYALSPCGEDIVVCKQDLVDICALIARCRVDSEPDCAPYRGQDSCGEVIEDWILTVRYAESPSRGITALTGAGQGCGCSCAGPCSGKCGGGGSCGCGGGPACSCGAAKGLADPEPLRQPRLNRGAPPSCEPTLTCETYRYDVFRAPQPEDERAPVGGLAGVMGQLPGDMMSNIACCVKLLQAALPPKPGNLGGLATAAQKNAWFQWACQMRTALANYVVKTGGHNCEAIQNIQAIVIPRADSDTLDVGPTEAAFSKILFELMLDCFCSYALPQCPPPGDPRVPLALVKVRRGDCHVISVCNWTPWRKHVLTFPNLEYWFGFIPIIPLIRKLMHKICCETFGLRPMRPQGVRYDSARMEMDHDGPVVENVAEMRARAARDAPVDAVAPPVDEALNLNPFADFKIQPDLFRALFKRQDAGTTVTMDDFTRAMLERPNMTVDPTLDEADRLKEIDRISNSGLMAMFAGMASFAAPAAKFARTIAEPRQDHQAIDGLRATIERQSVEIQELRSGLADVRAARDKVAKPASARVRTNAARATKTTKTTASARRKPK